MSKISIVDYEQTQELKEYAEKKCRKKYTERVKELEKLLLASTDKIMIYDIATEIKQLKRKIESL